MHISFEAEMMQSFNVSKKKIIKTEIPNSGYIEDFKLSGICRWFERLKKKRFWTHFSSKIGVMKNNDDGVKPEIYRIRNAIRWIKNLRQKQV